MQIRKWMDGLHWPKYKNVIRILFCQILKSASETPISLCRLKNTLQLEQIICISVHLNDDYLQYLICGLVPEWIRVWSQGNHVEPVHLRLSRRSPVLQLIQAGVGRAADAGNLLPPLPLGQLLGDQVRQQRLRHIQQLRQLEHHVLITQRLTWLFFYGHSKSHFDHMLNKAFNFDRFQNLVFVCSIQQTVFLLISHGIRGWGRHCRVVSNLPTSIQGWTNLTFGFQIQTHPGDDQLLPLHFLWPHIVQFVLYTSTQALMSDPLMRLLCLLAF